MNVPIPRHIGFLRWLFFLLLTTTGGAKLLDMPGFITVVDSYRALPPLLLAPSAWALTLTELMLGAWLMWGSHLRHAAFLIVLMHFMYLGWLIMALMSGLALDNCGCFGAYLARPLTWFSPFEDFGLLILALIFFVGARKAGA